MSSDEFNVSRCGLTPTLLEDEIKNQYGKFNNSEREPLHDVVKQLLQYREKDEEGKSERDIFTAILREAVQREVEKGKGQGRDVALARFVEEYYLNGRNNSEVAPILNRIKDHGIAINATSLLNLRTPACNVLCDAINKMENTKGKQQAVKLAVRIIPPPQIKPVGIGYHISHLAALLHESAEHTLINIYGESGIGKTTLVYHLIHYVNCGEFFWPEIFWIDLPNSTDSSTRQLRISERGITAQLFEQIVKPAGGSHAPEEALAILLSHFAKRNHIIVIDNFRTVPEVKMILPTLRRLSASGTKFILISIENASDAFDIYDYPVPPLAADDSIRLLHQQAHFKTKTLSDEEAQSLAEIGEGNPQRLLIELNAYLMSRSRNDASKGDNK